MVPKGWMLVSLKDLLVGGVKNGYSANPAGSETGYWVLGLGALGDEGINPSEIKPVLPEERVLQNLLNKDDFLVSRSNTPNKVGRSIRFKNEIENCSYPDLMMRFRVDDKKVNKDYIEYQLKHSVIRSYFKSSAAGSSSSMVKINKSILEKTPILLPPLSEQKKIAQILSAWDSAISVTEKLLTNSQQQKKALMQSLLTGKKRLLDENGVRFSGGWVYLTFDAAFNIENKKSAQVKLSDYLQSGSVPIIDQGQKRIAGYCNNAEVYSDVPVIVFGDHTRCIKWIDFVFCPGADGTQVIKTSKKLTPKFGYYLISNTKIPNLGYSRHMRELKEKDFRLPLDFKEQQKIAVVLSAADAEISTLEKKLVCLKDEKKALMQQLLTGKRRVTVDADAA